MACVLIHSICRYPELVDHIIVHSGLIAHYKAEKEGADRVDNLNELVTAAAAFTQIEGYATDVTASSANEDASIPTPLAGFLSHAALEAGDNQAQSRTRCSAVDDCTRRQRFGVSQRVYPRIGEGYSRMRTV